MQKVNKLSLALLGGCLVLGTPVLAVEFNDLDRNGDNYISTNEFSTMNNMAFRRLDSDGDHQLSRPELLAGAQQRAQAGGNPRQMVARLMRRKDANQDGMLSLAEFGNQRAMDMFRRLDANGDGRISRAEWGETEGGQGGRAGSLPVTDTGTGGTAPEPVGTAPGTGGTAPSPVGTAPASGGTAPDPVGTAPASGGTAPDPAGTAPAGTGAGTPTQDPAGTVSGSAPGGGATAPGGGNGAGQPPKQDPQPNPVNPRVMQDDWIFGAPAGLPAN